MWARCGQHLAGPRGGESAVCLCGPASIYLPYVLFSISCKLLSSSFKSLTLTLNILNCLWWRWYLRWVSSILASYSGLPRLRSGNEFACQSRRRKRRRFDPWVMKIPWTGQPGGLYSPWGCKEWDTTEQTHTQQVTQFTWIPSRYTCD